MKSESRELKKIGIMSMVKISLLFGVVIAILTTLQFFLLKSIPSFAIQMGVDATTLTYGSLGISILFALLTYIIAGAVLAALYNLFAKMVGGFKFTLN